MSRHDWEIRRYRHDPPKTDLTIGTVILAVVLAIPFWGFLIWALWP